MAAEIRYSGQVVTVSSPSYPVSVKSGIISGGGGIPYTGEYEAIPSWDAQVFPTAGKRMRSDFTVESMLELEVPNDAGGLTLTI